MRPEVAGPVHVVAMRFDVLVNVRMDGLTLGSAVAVEFVPPDCAMFSALAFQARSLDHVPEVRNDAHLRPELPMFIEIDSPRIAATFGENLEHVARRMITPDAGVHPLTLIFGCSRFADV